MGFLNDTNGCRIRLIPFQLNNECRFGSLAGNKNNISDALTAWKLLYLHVVIHTNYISELNNISECLLIVVVWQTN